MDFVFRYGKLPIKTQMTIEYLYDVKEFEGGYTDFTVALGQKRQNSPNFRKRIIMLEEKGVVKVERIKRSKLKISLTPDWKDKI